jgi:SAM-dependent methyltransferase
VVSEIGVGGGRVAVQVYPFCASLTCFDISAPMLDKARAALSRVTGLKKRGVPAPKLSFVLMDAPVIPERFNATYDFVYCFDVLVHVDLHLMFSYFKQVRV